MPKVLILLAERQLSQLLDENFGRQTPDPQLFPFPPVCLSCLQGTLNSVSYYKFPRVSRFRMVPCLEGTREDVPNLKLHHRESGVFQSLGALPGWSPDPLTPTQAFLGPSFSCTLTSFLLPLPCLVLKVRTGAGSPSPIPTSSPPGLSAHPRGPGLQHSVLSPISTCCHISSSQS